jgi:D-aminopeptidase
MIVIATNAPVDSRQLQRIAKRAVLGLARTGSVMAHGSGDFVIAFTTANRAPHVPAEPIRTVELLCEDRLTPLFQAAVEAVEEAVYNSLTRATTVTGHRGRTVEAIPVAALRDALGP